MTRVRDWEHRTLVPLSILAVIFFVAYAWPILDPTLDDHWVTVSLWTQLIIWVLFCADFIVRLSLAPSSRQYLLHHLFDLLILILPIFQPLRLLRLLVIVRLMNRRAAGTFRGTAVMYAIAATVVVIMVSSLAQLEAERGAPGSMVNDAGDAVWWALTTMTTVGYGDVTPVTDQGRIISVGLMIWGIGLLATVTSLTASWILGEVNEEAMRRSGSQDHRPQHLESTWLTGTVTQADYRHLNATLTQLGSEVEDLRATVRELSAHLREQAAKQPPQASQAPQPPQPPSDPEAPTST